MLSNSVLGGKTLAIFDYIKMKVMGSQEGEKKEGPNSLYHQVGRRRNIHLEHDWRLTKSVDACVAYSFQGF